MPEIFFDLISGGSIEGYPGQYGAGRVFFDEDTRQFLRIEPPGGLPPEPPDSDAVDKPVDTAQAMIGG